MHSTDNQTIPPESNYLRFETVSLNEDNASYKPMAHHRKETMQREH